MLRTVYKDDERLPEILEHYPRLLYGRRSGGKNAAGYIMVLGRADDLIVVAGHNIGTAEVESALVSHQAVAEAAGDRETGCNERQYHKSICDPPSHAFTERSA